MCFNAILFHFLLYNFKNLFLILTEIILVNVLNYMNSLHCDKAPVTINAVFVRTLYDN